MPPTRQPAGLIWTVAVSTACLLVFPAYVAGRLEGSKLPWLLAAVPLIVAWYFCPLSRGR